MKWTRLWAERKIKFFGENFYKEKLKLCNLVIIFRPCLTYHPDLSLNIFKPLNFIIIKNLLSTNRKTNKNLMGGAKLWKISQKAGQDERYKKASTLLNWKKTHEIFMQKQQEVVKKLIFRIQGSNFHNHLNVSVWKSLWLCPHLSRIVSFIH